jgi:hypothetical protein
MKKIILSLALVVIALASNAQSDAYNAGMKGMISRIESAQSNPEAYQDASNGFLRIAAAEKNEWLPNYYAAYCLAMQAMFSKDKEKIDPMLDQADKLLAEISITVKSDEVMCLQAFSKATRISVDPMTRGMRYSSESAKFLEQAKSINAENPRIYFLQGESMFNTPEQFGGGKTKALQLFQTAAKKFAAFKPSSDLMPTWGQRTNEMMIAECKK